MPCRFAFVSSVVSRALNLVSSVACFSVTDAVSASICAFTSGPTEPLVSSASRRTAARSVAIDSESPF